MYGLADGLEFPAAKRQRLADEQRHVNSQPVGHGYPVLELVADPFELGDSVCESD